MTRKVLLAAALAGAGWAVFTQWPDISRYLKIRQMSAGDGHPASVPAGGSHLYPGPGGGSADGTGDFDSARRGGPATS